MNNPLLTLITSALCLLTTAANATLFKIGTLTSNITSGYSVDYDLIYDDNGRRVGSGRGASINGGLVWLNTSFNTSEVMIDSSLGTGENARQFASLFTTFVDDPTSTYYSISLDPGWTIDSWDSAWRLPHAGYYPTNNPIDSEILHLIVQELGNSLGSPVTNVGDITGMSFNSNPSDGFFIPYWLDQESPSRPGTEIWFNTTSGYQETVPELFHGGNVMFVRSATASFDLSYPPSGSTGVDTGGSVVGFGTVSPSFTGSLDEYRYDISDAIATPIISTIDWKYEPTTVSIPEPSILLLAGVGLIGIGVFRRSEC